MDEIRSIEKKVTNGKLLRIKISIENNTISNIRITGDFFLHPEIVIDRIEEALKGKKISDVSVTVSEILEQNGGIMIGCNPSDIQEIIEEGLK